MANTYTQLYIHFVFVVQDRASLINKLWKDELYKYITAIVQNKKHKLISINGMPDHIHLFVGLNPQSSISNLMKDVKASSSKWINEKGFVKGKFRWQLGYGAFSYSQSHISNVINYIENQEHHHKKLTFNEEYKLFLEKYNVDFDIKYLFNNVN